MIDSSPSSYLEDLLEKLTNDPEFQRLFTEEYNRANAAEKLAIEKGLPAINNDEIYP